MLNSVRSPRIGLLPNFAIYLLMLVFVGNLPAFSSIFAFRGLGFIAAAVGVIAMAVSQQRQSFADMFRDVPVFKFILGLMAMVFLSVPMSVWVGGAFSMAKTYLYTIAFFFSLVVLAKGENGLRVLLNSGLLVFALLAFGLVMNHGQGRAMIEGSLYDSNDVAYVLLSFMPLLFYYLHSLRIPVVKWIGYFVILTGVLGLGLTESRGGVLAFVVVFLVFLRFEKVSFKLILSGALIGLIALNFLPGAFWERMATLTDLSSDYNMQSEFGRMAIWEHGLDMFYSNLLTGVGVGQFSAGSGMSGAVFMTAHNSVIQIAAELGLIGLVCYLVMVLYPLRTLKKRIKDPAMKVRPHYPLYKGLYISFVGQFCGSQFISAGYFKSLYYLLAVYVVIVLIDVAYDEESAAETVEEHVPVEAPEEGEKRKYKIKKKRTYTMMDKKP
ncbi:O-antigen ligase family protein [Desulfovibrio sp. Fe33]|uniref:O-antigen ligase family protein n=1 Tax=Desulfovibrio sp. Fe33 TaxID=3020842 RepID=UPI00234DC6FE|nr:O-antigen ligase family protein [Desulfovibrio sp. Fe33]